MAERGGANPGLAKGTGIVETKLEKSLWKFHATGD